MNITYPITKMDEGENEQLFNVLKFTCVSMVPIWTKIKNLIIYSHEGH
jgi:hypothetical protein